MTMTPGFAPQISPAERRQILQNLLLLETQQGNRVSLVGQYEATVWRMPRPVNHLLHGLFSLFTFGLWLIVWLFAVLLQDSPVLVGIGVDPEGHAYTFDPQQHPGGLL